MEIQVQELIDKIKKDGIKAANDEALKVKDAAAAEARRIVELAKKEADDIITRSKQEAERSEKAGHAALQQASRNLILAFRDEIQALLKKIVNENVSAGYNDDILKNTLPDLIKNWAVKGDENISLILPENTLNSLHGYFSDNLKTALGKGVDLKPNRKLSHGFHISNKDGSVFYDFSAEAITGLLSAYLNPKLASLLKDSAQGI